MPMGGQIVNCMHCSFSGFCKAHENEDEDDDSFYSCYGCRAKALGDAEAAHYPTLVPCGACNGIGKVWLGVQQLQVTYPTNEH